MYSSLYINVIYTLYSCLILFLSVDHIHLYSGLMPGPALRSLLAGLRGLYRMPSDPIQISYVQGKHPTHYTVCLSCVFHQSLHH